MNLTAMALGVLVGIGLIYVHKWLTHRRNRRLRRLVDECSCLSKAYGFTRAQISGMTVAEVEAYVFHVKHG